MTPEDCKFLTEWMGDKWHYLENDAEVTCACGEKWVVKSIDVEQHENRTFTTPDDMMAVKRKIVEKGEWDDFSSYAFNQWIIDRGDNPTATELRRDFPDWLLNETRFCQLAVSYLKGKHDG